MQGRQKPRGARRGSQQDRRPPPPPTTDFRSPARQARASAPIVSASSVTGNSLTVVIAIMCFLACLTAGAVYLINQSANAWFLDIASEVTVQIKPIKNTDIEKRVTTVALFLAKQKGIARVKPLTQRDLNSLLEPWLGNMDALTALPVPRLIALEIDRSSPPNLADLRVQLENDFTGVSLDDHRHWQKQIRTVTRSLALGGFAVLLLVGAATMAIIISATQSAMASNREIVEVLHFVGATDSFIAREFEKHFLATGIRASFIGAVFAAGVFLLLPAIMQMIGGSTVSASEIRRLVGDASLDLMGYGMLLGVVFVVSALCMVTSRIGVYRILQSRD